MPCPPRPAVPGLTLRFLAATILITTPALKAQAPTASAGLITQKSNADFATTLARVEPAIKGRGLFVMRVMDHAAAAAQFGRQLAPNTVILFGNPEIGSQMMACAPGAGIDLPQKLQLHEKDGAVMVTYNDPGYLKRRHAIEGCDEMLTTVAENLTAVADRIANGGGEAP